VRSRNWRADPETASCFHAPISRLAEIRPQLIALPGVRCALAPRADALAGLTAGRRNPRLSKWDLLVRRTGKSSPEGDDDERSC